jgi:hypothetical protein
MVHIFGGNFVFFKKIEDKNFEEAMAKCEEYQEYKYIS